MWAKELIETRMGECLEYIENRDDVFNRLYKTEIVFNRALLKGSSKEHLLKIKKVLMERYLEAMDVASTQGDQMYLNMANASKKMIGNYDCLIEWFMV